MADIALLAPGISETPEGYTVPGAQEIILKAITATFDGAAAAGSFVPTLQILAPNGAVLAACPTSTAVVAGESADVSWFPRGSVSAGSGPGGGIQFDTDNEGGWLEITTNNAGPGGFGIKLVDEDDNDLLVDTDSRLLINTEQNGGLLFGTAGGGAGGGGSAIFGLSPGQTVTVQDDTAAPIFVVGQPSAVTAFAALKVEGPTGATAAVRIAGATTAGAPISGTFQTGDVVFDHTGAIWICTAGGTPGTWTEVVSSNGITFDTANAGGFLDTTTSTAGPDGWGTSIIDAGGNGINIQETTNDATLTLFDGEVRILIDPAEDFGVSTTAGAGRIAAAGDGSVLSMTLGAGGTFSVFNHTTGAVMQATDTGKIALYVGTAPVAQPAAIPAPAGGATIDTQARAAIAAILAALGAAAGGIGVTA